MGIIFKYTSKPTLTLVFTVRFARFYPFLSVLFLLPNCSILEGPYSSYTHSRSSMADMDMIMKIQKAWGALDTDKNNKLSKDELSKLIKSLVPDIKDDPECEEKIQTTYDKLDLNGDGHVSFFEFCKIVKMDGTLKIDGIN